MKYESCHDGCALGGIRAESLLLVVSLMTSLIHGSQGGLSGTCTG